MRYLNLYEAFQSVGISNTLKFLGQKVGSTSSDRFLNSLKEFMVRVDFPINQLSNDDIRYISSKKAIQLRCESPVTNDKGIWVIKYWFSIERGFLGYTATGNKEEDLSRPSISHSHGFRITESFSNDDLKYIKDELTSTGEVWKVLDYNKLKTGDDVIGLFDSYLAIARIYVDRDDDDRVYAIQNVARGSFPESDGWREYNQYGSQSWWLFDLKEMGMDHKKLHYWRQSQNEINYIEQPKEVIPEEGEEDPLMWNLPLTANFEFSKWDRGSSMTSPKTISQSDFALVLYYDKLVAKDNSLIERPSKTKQQRVAQKTGATKLMSDDEIKKINIERYIQNISSTLNITDTEFSDLKKIVNKHLTQEFSFISILITKPNLSDLFDFTHSLYQIIDSENNKESHIDRVKLMYKTKTKSYYDRYLKFLVAKKSISGKNNMTNIFEEIYKLGYQIQQFINKIEISSIDNLYLVTKKIILLSDFIKMDRNRLDNKVRHLIYTFETPENIEHDLSQLDDYSNEEFNRDLKQIRTIEAFIKTL